MGHKVDGISIGQPPYLSVVSLELARRILNKQYPRQNITIPFPYVTNETVKVGETVFPDLPDSFFADFTDSGPNASVILCAQAALDGKACGPNLAVNLPVA
jgi:ribose transport system substrate-binding protein